VEKEYTLFHNLRPTPHRETQWMSLVRKEPELFILHSAFGTGNGRLKIQTGCETFLDLRKTFPSLCLHVNRKAPATYSEANQS